MTEQSGVLITPESSTEGAGTASLSWRRVAAGHYVAHTNSRVYRIDRDYDCLCGDYWTVKVCDSVAWAEKPMVDGRVQDAVVHIDADVPYGYTNAHRTLDDAKATADKYEAKQP
jgi:hypothetical protein